MPDIPVWKCVCGCTMLEIERDSEDGEFYLTYWLTMDQTLRWRTYFGNLWRALTARAYNVREVVLSEEDMLEMADSIVEEMRGD